MALSGCQLREKENHTVHAIPVEVETMVEQTVVSRHTYVGEIEEKNSVSLSASVTGQVLAVYVSRGERVQEGQLLLAIDSTQAVHARLAAAASLHQAEDGYARAYALYKEGGLTEQQRIELETRLAQARSMYATAERMVEDCRLVAPVSGVVSECRPRVGETIMPGVPQITIINMTNFVVRFSVPESEVATMRAGDRAWLEVPSVGVQHLSVVVTDKSLVPNRLAHTYDVTAALPARSDLLPGMMAKVQIAADVVSGFVLPQDCVQLLPDGAKVWVVNDGYAERRSVSVGQHVQRGVLVTEGLQAGDKVIIKGYQKLWQGAEITY